MSGREVTAIVMNMPGCGVVVKDDCHALAGDADHAEKAERISALTRELSELPALVPTLKSWLGQRCPGARPRIALYPPYALQHGQQLRGGVEVALNLSA